MARETDVRKPSVYPTQEGLMADVHFNGDVRLLAITAEVTLADKKS